MKYTLLLILMGLATPPLQAQTNTSRNAAGSNQTSGRISGSVIDSTTRKPIEFVNVALSDPRTGQLLTGVVGDLNGAFTLNRVNPGEYQLAISFVGYRTRTLRVSGGKDLALGTLELAPDVKTLREVTITGQKDLIEDKVDRIVYNAEKDITNTGGSAADVLKKVPQLAVDLDGNVQLRGSSNIKVLINNKPSSVMATSVADALRQIPSDQIKTVEVITSPSAKYDAEGSAGIINIITKKNNVQGINGSVYSTLGNRSSNAGVNTNIRKDRLGLNLGLGGNVWGNPGNTASVQDFRTSNSTLAQNSAYKNWGNFNYLQLGLDYAFNPRNSVNANVRLNAGQYDNDNLLGSRYTSHTNDSLLQQYSNAIVTHNRFNSVDASLGYTRTYDKPRQEWNVMALFSQNKRTSDYSSDKFNPDSVIFYRERNNNLGNTRESTLQTDYTLPFGEHSTLEFGAKGILRNVESNYQLSVYDTTRSAFVIDPSRANVFTYNQNIAASYASYTTTIGKKNNPKVGSRYEETFINANFSSSDNAKLNTRYGNFIPSLTFSRDLNSTQKLKLSYTRRIQRPQIYYLNPYVNSSDPRNLSSGNPNLSAELTNAYELSYNRVIKAVTLNTSFYLRQTTQAIQSVRTTDSSGISYTTFQNIGKNTTYGMNVFSSARITPAWNLNGNANVYYTNLVGFNAGWMYNLNMSSSWTLGKGFSTQVFGFYNSSRIQVQGVSGAFWYYNIAVKKEILKKKGSLSLALDNPFASAIRVKTTMQSSDFALASTNYNFNRGIRLSFNYQFGKMDYKAAPKEKKTIQNDDTRNGEGNSTGH